MPQLRPADIIQVVKGWVGTASQRRNDTVCLPLEFFRVNVEGFQPVLSDSCVKRATPVYAKSIVDIHVRHAYDHSHRHLNSWIFVFSEHGGPISSMIGTKWGTTVHRGHFQGLLQLWL